MTILLHIKTFSFHSSKIFMYNHCMTKQQPRKRSSPVFLILGLTFLTLGLVTNQTAFTWIAIAFVLISLISGGKWLRPRK
jgi:hypothetical protein